MAITAKIALAGNPNSGKTSIFNALTGSHHKVGNYPGVTVEKREGSLTLEGRTVQVCDLPGTYSLTAYSPDEMVARDYLLGESPDLVVCVLDSTNLERQLYLALQIQELGRPMLGVLNMSDEAEAQGLALDPEALQEAFGFPFVKTVGSRGRGIGELKSLIGKTLGKAGLSGPARFSPAVEEALASLEGAIPGLEPGPGLPARWTALKLLEKDEAVLGQVSRLSGGPGVLALASSLRDRLASASGKDAEILLSEERYAAIQERLESAKAAGLPARARKAVTADSLLMHPLLGIPAFLAILWGIFQLTFTIGAYPQAWLETLFSWLAGLASSAIPEGLFRLLVVNGVIGGVGAVFSFVPLIILLFLFLAILEDLGYMARAAYLMDRLLANFGLHGQSFLPLMLGFGCSVPAIMGARTLRSPRDRIATIVAIPFMTCGAKLPVYVLLAGAFFQAHQGAVVMGFYALGVVLGLLSALLFRKTVLKGDATPFVLELPPYRVPTAKSVLWHVWEKTSSYVSKMGTVILAAAVIVWAITTFPVLPGDEARQAETASTYLAANPGATGEEVEARVATVEAEAALEHSLAGRIGHLIEPIMAPLGFNWKMGIAAVTGYAAKEVVVSTLGILYQVGTEEAEDSEGLRASLAASPDFSPLVAIVLLLTTLIWPPCVAAMATIKGELGWRWLGIVVAYQLTLGWVLGVLVFQLGRALGLGL